MAGDLGEECVDRGGFRDVAMARHMRAELGRERLDPLLQRLALIGEHQLRAMGARLLGDAIGDGAAIGDPHHESAFAREDAGAHRHAHFLLSSIPFGSIPTNRPLRRKNPSTI